MPGLASEVQGRVLRSLELWRKHRLEMEVDGAGDWLVPSGSEPSLLHRVSLIEDTCTCDDHRYTGHRCKHR